MANQTKRADRSNLTLESVQKSFEDWRNERGEKRKIPQALWQQVIQILPHYSLSIF